MNTYTRNVECTARESGLPPLERAVSHRFFFCVSCFLSAVSHSIAVCLRFCLCRIFWLRLQKYKASLSPLRRWRRLLVQPRVRERGAPRARQETAAVHEGRHQILRVAGRLEIQDHVVRRGDGGGLIEAQRDYGAINYLLL